MLSRPLASTQKTLLAEALASYQGAMTGSPAEEYVLVDRGLDPVTVAVHRLGYAGPTASIPGLERFDHHLVIPSLAADGHPVRLKFRSLEPDDAKRYDQPHGVKQGLFNVRAFLEGSDTIVITEGEIDAMTMQQLGVPAVGLPGNSTWRPHYGRLFDGYNRVVLFKDNDEGGSKTDITEAKIRKESPDIPLLAVMVPGPGKDINDAYRAGQGALLYELATGRKANR